MTHDDLPPIPTWVHMADVPPTDVLQRPESWAVASESTPEMSEALWGDSGVWVGFVMLLLAFIVGVVVGVLVSR